MSKKINIYPMQCQLTGKNGSTVVNIIKLTQNGCLVNSFEQPMKVNEAYTATFVLPVKNIMVDSQVVVYKTYDEFKGAHGLVSPGNHVNELVFRNPSPRDEEKYL